MTTFASCPYCHMLMIAPLHGGFLHPVPACKSYLNIRRVECIRKREKA